MSYRTGYRRAVRNGLISAANLLGLSTIARRFVLSRFGNSHIRIVNYHAFSQETEQGFRDQLKYYSEHFDNASREDLDGLISGNSPKPNWVRPRLAITFDDGFVEQYTIAAPILEEFGFKGWFFVPTWHIGKALDGPTRQSGGIAGEFMSANHLRDLMSRGHQIGCHTKYHTRLTSELTDEQFTDEIIRSKSDLEAVLGQSVESFCWVRGDEPAYSARAQRHIEKAGYKYSFMTNLLPVVAGTHPLYLERTNIEADWPMSHTKFYLSGIMDFVYRAKRKRVAAKLN